MPDKPWLSGVQVKVFGFRLVGAALAALAWVFLSAEVSHAQTAEEQRAVYSEALAFCREVKAGSHAFQQEKTSPLTLRSDKKVLCVNDWIFSEHEIAVANSLEQGGYAVIQGFGGEVFPTIVLADILKSKQAVVIVSDYCFAACANYLLFASAEAFVPKDAIVAWTNLKAGLSNDCFGFVETPGSDAQHFGAYPCAPASVDAQRQALADREAKFYYSRGFPAGFKEPPESTAIRRILKRRFDETGVPPAGLFWTWNPRYSARLKTKLIYEAYPHSQDEIDAILAQLRLSQSVIYDP